MAKPPMKVTAARSNFESARQTLETFRHEHMGVFEEYDQLCDQYNEMLSDMKAAIREHAAKLGKSYGDFTMTAVTKIDIKSLLEILGEDVCVDKGYVQKSFTIQRQVYDHAVKKGKIDQDIVDVVEIDGTTQLRGPKPVDLYKR